jgi:hypothetical protein
MSRDDAMSNCVQAKKKEVCKFEKVIEKINNVQNEDTEKILIQLVGAFMKVGFLLKCLIVLLVFLFHFLAKNW